VLSWTTHPVLRWLMTDARKLVDSNDFLDGFANELRMAGVDVCRITTGIPILHPQIFSFSGLWELGKQTSERLYRAGPDMSVMANSPIRIAYEGGGLVRCDLSAAPKSDEYAILTDLRRGGYTDYVVHSVPFADGSYKALSFATKRRSGFNDE
jgi:adenylate cyclase